MNENEVVEPALACHLCGKIHQWQHRRYRCVECKTVLCLYQVHNGKHWNRRDQGVHLIFVKRGGGTPDLQRLCGVVEAVEEVMAIEDRHQIEDVIDGKGEVESA